MVFLSIRYLPPPPMTLHSIVGGGGGRGGWEDRWEPSSPLENFLDPPLIFVKLVELLIKYLNNQLTNSVTMLEVFYFLSIYYTLKYTPCMAL